MEMMNVNVEKMLDDYAKELGELRSEWMGLDVPEYEYEDVEDYMDDGDDRGDCVPTVGVYEGELTDDECVRKEDARVIVYKQLVETMFRIFVGVFSNKREAREYLENQGVYEQFWTDQFGKQWEIVFDRKSKCRWCEDCEFFKDCYEFENVEYNREADAAYGIADNCDCYERVN